VQDVEADARGCAHVVGEVDGDGGVVNLGGMEPEGRGHDVQRPRGTRGVDEDHRTAVRRGIVERSDAWRPAEALGANAHRSLIAAKIDVLACERRLTCERRHASLVERRPEVHGLAPDEDDLAPEVCDLGEDWPDFDVREIRHSSGLVPRRLTRALGNVK
jgi:hypothetical protein